MGGGADGGDELHQRLFRQYRQQVFQPRDQVQPDGGDGGKGGSVKFIVDTGLTTLLDFKYKKKFSIGKNPMEKYIFTSLSLTIDIVYNKSDTF